MNSRLEGKVAIIAGANGRSGDGCRRVAGRRERMLVKIIDKRRRSCRGQMASKKGREFSRCHAGMNTWDSN